MEKFVYFFKEGNKNMSNLLGGKGANLCEMSSINIPIPQGIIITTSACNNFLKNKDDFFQNLKPEILAAVSTFKKKPLLFSVRSGAPISMPGMMDTILNLGFNDSLANYLIEKTNNEKFVYESYSRFILMFSEIVMGIPKSKFNNISFSNYSEKISKLKNIYKVITNTLFPETLEEQLFLAIKAIFNSWNNERAILYRDLHNISHDLGTAVVVQEMVFGNFNDKSGTGVIFSRNPSNGKKELYGEYILKAQGEDIVAGLITPFDISNLNNQLPEIYSELKKYSEILEKHFKDMQDIEFTIENGKLFILQTRNGKRTPEANLNILLDFVNENILSKEEAIIKIDSSCLEAVLCGSFTEKSLKENSPIAIGLPASNGVATGKIILNSNNIPEDGDYILLREETSPEDLKGMYLANGILTSKGGRTSHGAVVARGMGKCCITGCDSLKIENDHSLTINNIPLKEGDYISIDGGTGYIYKGKLEIEKNNLNTNIKTFINWSLEFSKLRVRVNADTPEDALVGYNFGAEGIGLCRTEHMFFKEDRIWKIRQMILSTTIEERKNILQLLSFIQFKDFYDIFKVMKGLPVNIRLLDPPLHEFLPKTSYDKVFLSNKMNISIKEIEERIISLNEHNPMLGHRGCRLGISFPEIYEMQISAIKFALDRCKRENIPTSIEIMIPFVGYVEELQYIKKYITEQLKGYEYKIGTMIELPRACILSHEISKHVDFFSYGTNDLTQTTLGISRDDSIKFLNTYQNKLIYKHDPFKTLDKDGVGTLLKTSIELGKTNNSNLKLGVCGEHGGDPESIKFFNQLPIEYISCSPFKIPVAILSAAQSEISKNF
ncbi:MAG: pyruvate, phosphate dikinase [Cetobacterium sp.]|uniref:pyruvate, phosphate dikinase n=1 Tax=Cetobacterium sp. TaxID=2071632 RepID=UPI003F343921